MNIRKCELNDLQALTKFYGEVVDFLVTTVNYPRWTPGVYPCEQTIKKEIESGSQFGVFDGDNVIGAFVFNEDTAGNYGVGEWKKELKQGEFAIVHTLATHFNHYGKGIAKKMVEFALEMAKSMGYMAIRLDVVPDNYPARKLYESFGFSFAGEKDLERGFEHIPTFCLYEFNF